MEHELEHHEIGFKGPAGHVEFLVDSSIVGNFDVRAMIAALERNWGKVMKCGTCPVASRLLFAKQLKDEMTQFRNAE